MNRLVLALVVMACGRSDTAHVAPPAAAPTATATASAAAAPEAIQLGTPLLRRPPVPGGRNMYGEPTSPSRVMIGAIAASADGALLVTVDRVYDPSHLPVAVTSLRSWYGSGDGKYAR